MQRCSQLFVQLVVDNFLQWVIAQDLHKMGNIHEDLYFTPPDL